MSPTAEQKTQITSEMQNREREIRPHGDMIAASRFFLAKARFKETRDLDRRHYEYAALVFSIFALDGFLNLITKWLGKDAKFNKKALKNKIEIILGDRRLSQALRPERKLIQLAIGYRNALAHPEHVPKRGWTGRKRIRVKKTGTALCFPPMKGITTALEKFCDSPKLIELVAAVERTCAAIYNNIGGDPGPLKLRWDSSGWSAFGASGWQDATGSKQFLVLPPRTAFSRKLPE